MIGPRFERNCEIGTEESRAEFGDQLVGGIAGIAPPLAPEFADQARRVSRPVGQFVQQRRVIAFGIGEALEGGSCTRSASIASERPAAAMANIGAATGGRKRSAASICAGAGQGRGGDPGSFKFPDEAGAFEHQISVYFTISRPIYYCCIL